MRKYELMTVFPIDEELFAQSKEKVLSVLKDYSVQIESEDAFGDRDLAYEVKKRKKGRYVLFTIKSDANNIVHIDRQFKLNANLLTYMFIRVDE